MDFAIWIVEFSSHLGTMKFFSLKEQLFKSGTAIGALVREAQSPESKKDFVHKMKIAAKEADETEYWLQLCALSPHLPDPPNERLQQLQEVMKLLSSIIATSKKASTPAKALLAN